MLRAPAVPLKRTIGYKVGGRSDRLAGMKISLEFGLVILDRSRQVWQMAAIERQEHKRGGSIAPFFCALLRPFGRSRRFRPELQCLRLAVKEVKAAARKNRACKWLMVNAVKPNPSKSKYSAGLAGLTQSR
jgi:hypothetical protein